MKGRNRMREKYTCFNWWNDVDLNTIKGVDTAITDFGGIVSILYENDVVENRTVVGKARYGILYPFYANNINNVVMRWRDIVALGHFPDNGLITGDKYEYAINVNRITDVSNSGNGKIRVQIDNDPTVGYTLIVGSDTAIKLEKMWKCRKAGVNPHIVDALERQNRIYSERIAELELCQQHQNAVNKDVENTFLIAGMLCGFAVGVGIICLDSMRKK